MEKFIRGYNLTHQMLRTVGIAIVQGKYSDGNAMFTEAQLSEEFKVSRTITREVVKALSAKGLLSSRPKRGTIVTPPNQWNMFDPDVLSWLLAATPTLQLLKEFAQLRLAIEPVATALAASCCDENRLQDLKSAVENISTSQNQPDNIREAIIAFHAAILTATGNRFFPQLQIFIDVAVTMDCQMQGSAGHNADPYHEIYNCIQTGQVNEAKNSMHKLLEKNLQLINEKMMQKSLDVVLPTEAYIY